MKYAPVLSDKAMKRLDRLDRKAEQRIRARFEELAGNPEDPSISNKLETMPGKRYSRVGDWRIIYEVREAEKILYIVTVQHRSKVYRDLLR